MGRPLASDAAILPARLQLRPDRTPTVRAFLFAEAFTPAVAHMRWRADASQAEDTQSSNIGRITNALELPLVEELAARGGNGA